MPVTEATSGPRLRAAQLRLRELITAPSGRDPEQREREIAALLRGDPQRPASVRLEVYAHAWLHRIQGALAEDFGALARVLGEDAFRELVIAYLGAHPPCRPSLRDAGAQLPEFLARSPAAAALRERHPFAPDLARLEWALIEAFDAADAPVLAREALAGIPPEGWAGLRLVFQPSFQLLSLDFPVDRLRRAHDQEEAGLPALIEPLPTRVCVWRSDERVFHRALEPIEAEALARALAGASFGRLCEGIAERLSEAEAPLRAASLLAGWQRDGLLSTAIC
jgi:hypothetical protein